MTMIACAIAIGAMSTGGESTPVVVPELDPVIYSGISSKAQLAFAFDRIVEGYSGNTVNLKRSSDNATANFGFDAKGYFDKAGVEAWAGASDISIVHFIDQVGTGKLLLANGTVYLRQSGTYNRFGTDWDSETGLISRSTSKGAFGGKLDGGTSGQYFRLDTSGVSVTSDGFEIHMLCSHQTRKRDNTTDPLGTANRTTETYFQYGNSTYNAILQNQYGNYMYGAYISDGTGTYIYGGQAIVRQYAQELVSFHGGYSSWGYGRNQSKTSAPKTSNATLQTRFGDGTFTNKTLLIGAKFNGASIDTAGRGNFVFGGVVVTKSLTQPERFQLNSRMNAIGQQHRVLSQTDLEAMFEEIIDFKDYASNQVVGKNNLTTLTFDTTGSPAWSANYDINGSGVLGLRNTTSGTSYKFKATNNYFAARTKCSALVVGRLHTADFHSWFGQGTGTYSDSGTGTQGACLNHSLSMGFDHNANGLYVQGAASRGNCGTVVDRRVTYNYPAYDGANQPMGKYGHALTHNNFTYGETVVYNSVSETWERTDWRTKAHTDQPTPENVMSGVTGDMTYHIATWKAPDAYNRADSGRNAYGIQAENWSYLSTPCTPIGHADGAVANSFDKVTGLPIGNVCDSDDNAQIMSSFRVGHQISTRKLFGFFPDGKVLSRDEIEQIQVNLWKILI